MLLYKFYKNGCHPCQLMKKLMGKFEIPNDVVLIEIDVEDPKNEDLVEIYNIDVVPVLLCQNNGNKLVGVKSINVMKAWIEENRNGN